jgi:hypothetical protein
MSVATIKRVLGEKILGKEKAAEEIKSTVQSPLGPKLRTQKVGPKATGTKPQTHAEAGDEGALNGTDPAPALVVDEKPKKGGKATVAEEPVAAEVSSVKPVEPTA